MGLGGPMVIVAAGSAGAAMLEVCIKSGLCRCKSCEVRGCKIGKYEVMWRNSPSQDVATQEQAEEDRGSR